MPKPVRFHSGSVIYFQGDPADKIYILQTGTISLVYQDIDTGADVRDSVQPGEFFGVKSALGRYPREENAAAVSDATVMVFTVPEFENVAMANTRIIMKMLKVFSNQMRRVHKQVSKLMAKEDVSPADGLFNIGELYLKNSRFSHAKYVFGRYLTFYPSGKDVIQAARNYELAEEALKRYADGKGSYAASGRSIPAFLDAADKTEKSYNEAVSLVSLGKYQEAFTSFKQITDENVSPIWTAKASFGIGRCMFLLNKYEDSLKYFTNMLMNFPKHPDLKDAMFIMGQCNENIGRKDQAAAFYKKIISLGGSDALIEKVTQALDAMGA